MTKNDFISEADINFERHRLLSIQTKWYNPWRINQRKVENMYIDPNTGGIVFQALAAAFVAVSGILMVFSGKIRQGIAKIRRSMRKDGGEGGSEDQE